MFKTVDLFDFEHSIAGLYLSAFEYPYQALAGITDLIKEIGKNLWDDYLKMGENIWKSYIW